MKKTYIILVGIMVLAFPSLVSALEFEECKEEIKVGDEITLKLKATDDINEGDTFNWVSTNTSFATVNPKTDTLSAVVKGIAPGTVSITASNSSNEVSCQTKVIAAKSNDATLKSLKVDDEVVELKSDVFEYTVKIDSTTTKVKISGTTNHEKATVSGFDEVTLDKDNMKAEVKVVAEDTETTKTYTIKFEIKEKKKITDFTLSELEITGAEIEPKFNKNTFTYTLKVKDGETPKVSKYASTDDNAQVFVSKYDKTNGITITVTDGTTKKDYKFVPPVEEKEKSVYLSKLEVVAYPFEEVFSKEVSLYTTTIPYEVEEVTLNAIPEDENAKVTTTSLKNLKVGRNQITITVKNGDKSKTYTIYITREKEEKLEEKATSIIKTGDSNKTSKNSDYDIPDVDNPDTTLNLITVTVASIILFASGIIGIIFFIKTSPKRLKKEVFNKHEAKEASPLIEAKAKSTKTEEENNE